eukprot:g4118.t1
MPTKIKKNLRQNLSNRGHVEMKEIGSPPPRRLGTGVVIGEAVASPQNQSRSRLLPPPPARLNQNTSVQPGIYRLSQSGILHQQPTLPKKTSEGPPDVDPEDWKIVERLKKTQTRGNCSRRCSRNFNLSQAKPEKDSKVPFSVAVALSLPSFWTPYISVPMVEIRSHVETPQSTRGAEHLFTTLFTPDFTNSASVSDIEASKKRSSESKNTVFLSGESGVVVHSNARLGSPQVIGDVLSRMVNFKPFTIFLDVSTVIDSTILIAPLKYVYQKQIRFECGMGLNGKEKKELTGQRVDSNSKLYNCLLDGEDFQSRCSDLINGCPGDPQIQEVAKQEGFNRIGHYLENTKSQSQSQNSSPTYEMAKIAEIEAIGFSKVNGVTVTVDMKVNAPMPSYIELILPNIQLRTYRNPTDADPYTIVLAPDVGKSDSDSNSNSIISMAHVEMKTLTIKKSCNANIVLTVPTPHEERINEIREFMLTIMRGYGLDTLATLKDSQQQQNNKDLFLYIKGAGAEGSNYLQDALSFMKPLKIAVSVDKSKAAEKTQEMYRNIIVELEAMKNQTTMANGGTNTIDDILPTNFYTNFSKLSQNDMTVTSFHAAIDATIAEIRRTSLITPPTCPSTAAGGTETASCKDPDGSCADGTDEWHCGTKFYCSHDLEYAL